MDDFTKMTWVYLMKHKSNFVAILINLIIFIKNHFKSTVKFIRTDNAKELCDGAMVQLYHRFGIVNQKSCVKTPQQNGIVERKHHHLLETARALLFQYNLPKSFWGGCVLCSTYLINRLPLSTLHNMSPYKKLFGTKPNNNHLKTFGCLCFVSTMKQGRSKFDPQAEPCVFIGYPFGQKAYKIYNLVTKKLWFPET